MTDTPYVPTASILIVDDTDLIRETFRAVYLKKEHIPTDRIYTAADGIEGIETLQRIPRNGNPILILADQEMPRLTGIGMLEQMAAQGLLGHDTYVVMTGSKLSLEELKLHIDQGLIHTHNPKPLNHLQLGMLLLSAEYAHAFYHSQQPKASN